MKIVVTGVGGQLGHDVMNEIAKRGYDGIGTGRSEFYSGVQDQSAVCGMSYRKMDVTDIEEVKRVLLEEHPDVVINCAAWTAVDDAEDEANRPGVRAANALGAGYIADVCRIIDAKMIQLSTDYVFDGHGDTPWNPDCKEYGPLNYYGETKLEGELNVADALQKYYIVRVSCVFGSSGANFVNAILRASKTHDELRVVNDQIGTPTYTEDLARVLIDMAEAEEYGYYHVTNSGRYVSRCELAETILKKAGKNTRVIPVTSEEYGLSKALRPCNSRLDLSKLEQHGFAPMPDWEDALERYLGKHRF